MLKEKLKNYTAANKKNECDLKIDKMLRNNEFSKSKILMKNSIISEY